MSLVLTKELVYEIEQSEIECLSSRLAAIRQIEGNPMGIEIKQFGNAICFSAAAIPGPSFNTVKGLKDEDEKFIDALIAYYEQRNIPVRFELTPAHVSSRMLTCLNEKGFYHADFHTVVYVPLSNMPKGQSTDTGIIIRKLKSQEYAVYADIYADAFAMPAFLKPSIEANNKVLDDDSRWEFYLAIVEGKPAGTGVLFIQNDIAVLAAAATLPEFRGIGVQSALIKQRLNQAITKKCRLLVGHAGFASTSLRNMERAGLKVAYNKAIWRKRSVSE
ncbi:GNAT family N-acetyltransferase [Sediminibacillus albus]|uniref:N-acetyltransferase domain-containing protein n=1 Tax=Sediminibacillus albus TaxID=407036 RepID=A0A1G8VI91_9BACI|nr:GNAT family N-acetyltransferase [Sediminibacillus albus]SDJ65733.1 hypothetical protein SAMN05216243_0127 [Sediminibacillus albus]